jgi:hypothetical protein
MQLMRLFNVVDLARKAVVERPSLYRAFGHDHPSPKFSTVLAVLDGMNLQIKVVARKAPREVEGPAKLLIAIENARSYASVHTSKRFPRRENIPGRGLNLLAQGPTFGEQKMSLQSSLQRECLAPPSEMRRRPSTAIMCAAGGARS